MGSCDENSDCGPMVHDCGTQNQSRTCTDGDTAEQKCTETDTSRKVSCKGNGAELPGNGEYVIYMI